MFSMVWRMVITIWVLECVFCRPATRAGMAMVEYKEIENNSEEIMKIVKTDIDPSTDRLLVYKSRIAASYQQKSTQHELKRRSTRKRRGISYFLRLCIVRDTLGRCIRAKRFGLWHSTRPLEKSKK